METETIDGSTRTLTYDAVNQLTDDGSTSYSFDLAGNRTMSGYQTGASNQLTNDGIYTYTYDAEGNRVSKSKSASDETWTFGYSVSNQMTWMEERATAGGTLLLRVEEKYDALGRRIEEARWTSATGTVTTRFTYQGANVRADLDGSNALVMRYVRPDGVDALGARINPAGVASWYLTDRQGTVQGNTDASGALSNKNSYDGFGGLVSQSNASASDRYLYTGRELQIDSGLQYNRARWYDTRNGSWTTIDPRGFDAGDDNLYRYVKNGPTNATDPTGEYLIAENEKAKNDALALLNGQRYQFSPSISASATALETGQFLIHVQVNGKRPFQLQAGQSGFDVGWLQAVSEVASSPDHHRMIRAADTSWQDVSLSDWYQHFLGNVDRHGLTGANFFDSGPVRFLNTAMDFNPLFGNPLRAAELHDPTYLIPIRNQLSEHSLSGKMLRAVINDPIQVGRDARAMVWGMILNLPSFPMVPNLGKAANSVIYEGGVAGWGKALGYVAGFGIAIDIWDEAQKYKAAGGTEFQSLALAVLSKGTPAGDLLLNTGELLSGVNLHPEGFGNPLTETEYQVKFLQEALTAVFIRDTVTRPVTAPATAGQASNCFPAHTLVATEQGRRPIAEIQAQERVWAFDVVSCQWRLCRVLQTFASFYEDDSVLLTVAGERIESTYHHPYWVVRGEGLSERTCLEHIPEVPADAQMPGRWVDAGDVRPGDEVLSRDGRIVQVEAVQYRPYQGWMYNFQVEELHCYAVGENGVLVHNNSWWDRVTAKVRNAAQNAWNVIKGTKPAAPASTPRVTVTAHEVPLKVGGGEAMTAGIFDQETGHLHLANGHQPAVSAGRLEGVANSRLSSISIVIKDEGISVINGGSMLAPRMLPPNQVASVRAAIESHFGKRVVMWTDIPPDPWMLTPP